MFFREIATHLLSTYMQIHHINNHNCNRIFQSFCTRVFLWFHYISLSSVLHQAYIRYDRVRKRKNLFWNSRLSVNWTRNIKSGEIQNNSDVFVFSLNFLLSSISLSENSNRQQFQSNFSYSIYPIIYNPDIDVSFFVFFLHIFKRKD